MQIVGKIKKIGQVQQVSDTFKKRDFLLDYAENPDYPQVLKIETIQKKTEILDNVKIGDMVEVSISLEGREWTDPQGVVKYFNTTKAWKINLMQNPSEENSINDDAPF